MQASDGLTQFDWPAESESTDACEDAMRMVCMGQCSNIGRVDSSGNQLYYGESSSRAQAGRPIFEFHFRRSRAVAVPENREGKFNRMRDSSKSIVVKVFGRLPRRSNDWRSWRIRIGTVFNGSYVNKAAKAQVKSSIERLEWL